YEAPENPDVRVDSSVDGLEASADRVLDCLRKRGLLG
ncbi:adenylyl-sulfate kinase, partial [Candidatus Poribacteria bacterium]|nr:adenylyl-sulfate kinase [Candidatus Poribacteria bacterium]